jgi:D-aspartate ligase
LAPDWVDDPLTLGAHCAAKLAAFVRGPELNMFTSRFLARSELTPGEVDLAPAKKRFQDCPPGEVGAVVIGGDHGSLGVARSLGRRGIPIWFISDDNIIARMSCYTRRSLAWAGPGDSGAKDDLLALADRHGLQGWVLYPCGDAEVKFISQNHAELSAVFRVCVPPWEVTQLAADKHLMYQHAASLGIPYPKCYFPRDHADLISLDCRFPLILKPAMKEERNDLTLAKAWRADDLVALLTLHDEASALVGRDNIVVQELIPGAGSTQLSYAAVWDRGVPVASMIARRTRQYPTEFGTGTYVQTIEQEEVERAACRFLASLDYSGTVEMEFKYDERDRRYKILDVNPRIWTWVSLGKIAGVDFPYVQWRLAMGEKVPRTRARSGAAWMYVPKDLVAACREMARGRLSPLAYLKSFRAPLAFASFAVDDPLPAIFDLPLALWRHGRRWFA